MESVENPYDNPEKRSIAWNFAQKWPEDILARITGETVDGEKVGKQDITSMLNKLEDLGPFTADEWTLFFNKLRVEGI